MDEMFIGAGIPLVHIPSGEKYDTVDLVALFQLAVTKIGGSADLRIENPKDTVPNCPVAEDDGIAHPPKGKYAAENITLAWKVPMRR